MEYDILKKFGLIIRKIREEKKLSQEQLSELSGLDRTYINSSYLNIGLTDSIKLIDEGHLDTDQTAYLLNKLKQENDYGNFNKIFK